MTDVKDHLRNLSKIDFIPNDHKNYLQKLKDNNFEPKVIYDIGSCVMHWTNVAKKVWPNATYVLFDAFDKVEFLYIEQNYDKYHIGVLTDKDNKEVKFYQNSSQPTGNSYYKEIGCGAASERLFPENNYILKKGYTLDTIIQTYNFPQPDLIKIDTQGTEIDILKGATNVLKNTKHLIVELQKNNYNRDAPNVNISLPFIENLGFKCIAPLFCDNGADGDYGFCKFEI